MCTSLYVVLRMQDVRLVILCVHPDTPALTTFASTCMYKYISLLRALGLQPRISPLCMSVGDQSGVCLGCSDVCFGVLCGCTYSCAHPVMSLGTHLHIIRMCAFAPYLRMWSFWVILGAHVSPISTPRYPVLTLFTLCQPG